MTDHPFTFESIEGVDWLGLPAVKVLPCGYTLPETYARGLGDIYNLQVRGDDVWVLGLLKCGTTWTTEAVWGVYHEADLSEAKSRNALDRWMLPEMTVTMKYSSTPLDDKARDKLYKTANHYFTGDMIETINEAKSPRFIRSHYPISLLLLKLLDTCKVIYVARNLKDAWISYFNMLEGGQCEASDIASLSRVFMENRGMHSPWCKHVVEAWNLRNHKNMFFVFYEEMKKDLPGVLRRLAKFLNKNLTEEQFKILEDHLTLESMRKNKHINCEDFKQVGWLGEKQQFIRKGMVGEWKEYFSEELLEEYEAWWKKYAGDSDFKFPE